MQAASLASRMLAQEARALLTRLARVRPFALHEATLPAASLQPNAQMATERYLLAGRRELRSLVLDFLHWLQRSASQVSAEEAQRRFTIVRLKFNAVLTQFDLFSDAVTQRSEHEVGVWLRGLDVVAEDALRLPGYYQAPPLVCYLDRGVGAAIRRARTRLPGGGDSPVAIIRVPRERMVGSGIASSLIHEVGHQASALLDLSNSLRPLLRGMQRSGGTAWRLFERWMGEILSDFWSCARIGISATLGLMAVLSLPRALVFRLSLDDPHPVPWLRVHLSCAMGQALYPHAQWQRLAALWNAYYPPNRLPPPTQRLLSEVQAAMPAFVALLTEHRPRSLRGASLREVLQVARRQPQHLAVLLQRWRETPADMYLASPTLVFAVLGQARAVGQLTPEEESHLFAKLLTHWALRSTLEGNSQASTESHRQFLLA